MFNKATFVSFCRLCYQQVWCYKMCLFVCSNWGGKFNASALTGDLSVNPKRGKYGWIGRVKGGGITRLIHEIVINTLTLRLWGFVFLASKLLCVSVHHQRPGWCVSQTEPKMVHQYYRSGWRPSDLNTCILPREQMKLGMLLIPFRSQVLLSHVAESQESADSLLTIGPTNKKTNVQFVLTNRWKLVSWPTLEH